MMDERDRKVKLQSGFFDFASGSISPEPLPFHTNDNVQTPSPVITCRMKIHTRLFAGVIGCLILPISFCLLIRNATAEEATVSSQLQDPPSQERLDAATRLMEVKGARQQAITGCLAGLERQRTVNPAFSEALYLALKKEMTTDENIDALIQMLASNFAKRFTVDELDALSAFYATPLGKRIASEEANLSIAGMQAGQKWGRELGEKVDKAMLKKKDLR